MSHTNNVTRKPAQAQSAYASKLLFKQDASTSIVSNSSTLINNVSVLFGTIFGNALALGTLFNVTTGDGTTTS